MTSGTSEPAYPIRLCPTRGVAGVGSASSEMRTRRTTVPIGLVAERRAVGGGRSSCVVA